MLGPEHNVTKLDHSRIKAQLSLLDWLKPHGDVRITLALSFSLRTMFTSVPSRYLVLENVDVFSLLDFELVENGNLIEMLEPLAVCGAAHIEDCKVRHILGDQFLPQIVEINFMF